MANIGSLSRLASSAVTSIRLGAIHSSRIPVFAVTSLINNHENLCKPFRELNLSPLEAQLSATHQPNINFISQSPAEYRLPSLIKPVSITVPSLYNGAILEKDLPPLTTITEMIDPAVVNKEIHDTPSSQITEKQAARLIVIRQKKMKRHKIKKLRKKMRFVWLRIIQRREYKREKDFQAEQMAIVREGEAFDAAKYVEEVLRLTNQKPEHRYFKGKRLPRFIVKELKEEQVIKRKNKAEHIQALKEMKQELGIKDG